MKTSDLLFILLSCSLFFSCKKSDENSNGSINDPLRDGLIAYYPFNANVKDESGNQYDLVNHGAALISDRFGNPQKAFKFNGISDFMEVPKILKADSLRAFSISVWVRPETLGHSAIISFLPKIDMICASFVGLNSQSVDVVIWQQMITAISSTNCTTSISKGKIENPLDKWCHIVIIQEYPAVIPPRNRYTQYFNGVKLAVTSPESSISPIPGFFSRGGIVGGNNNSGDFSLNYDLFKGGIDNIRIYDRALSAEEVTKLYTLNE